MTSENYCNDGPFHPTYVRGERRAVFLQMPRCSLRAASIAGMIAEAATIVAAALALAVVAGIDARQTARAKALELMD